VERVVTDATGAATGLLVEIKDTDPDRYVTIPLDGLTVVQDGDDQDLRSNLTRQQLLAICGSSIRRSLRIAELRSRGDVISPLVYLHEVAQRKSPLACRFARDRCRRGCIPA
jgi:hypothetical protein